MNPLFKRELKANSKAFIIWSILTILLIAIAYWEYSVIDNPAELGLVFTSFPQVASVMFGLSPLGMEDIIGYGSLMQYYIYFIGIAYAYILGNKLIQKELDDQTAEFLFTKPISRQHVYQTKALIGTIYLGLFNLIAYGASVIAMTRIGDSVYTNSEIAKYMAISYLGLFLFMYVIFNIALSGNIVFVNKRYGSMLAGAFIAYSYMTYILVLSFEKLNELIIISPWRYFTLDLIVENEVKIIYILILLILAFVAKAVALKYIKIKQF